MKIAYSKSRACGAISGITIVASSEDPAYPATNLLLGQVAKVWRSVAAAAPIATKTLTIVVPAGVTNCLGIFGLNATSIGYTIKNTAETALYFSGILDLHRTQYTQINMSATGEGGVEAPDSIHIDNGTNNFTVVWRGSVPDWTPSTVQYLAMKYVASYGYFLAINTDGRIRLLLYRGDVGTSYYSNAIAAPLVDGSEHEIAMVITRETASVPGSVIFYMDGIDISASPDGAPAIAAATTVSIANAAKFSVLGYSTYSYAGTCTFAAVYTFALSAANVLDLYSKGISDTDKWGRETPIGSDTSWTGATGATPPTGWSVGVAGTFSIFDSGDGAPFNACLKIAHNGTNNNPRVYKNFPVVIGKRYRASMWRKTSLACGAYDIRFGSGSGSFDYYSSGTASNATWTKHSCEFVATTATCYAYFITASSTAGEYSLFDEVFVYEIGASLALEPAGIHKDKWYDSSTNELDGVYPTSGVKISRSGASIDNPSLVTVPDTSAESSWDRAWIDWENNGQALHIILTLYAHPTATYHEVGEIVVCETVAIPDPLKGLSESNENFQVVQKKAGGGLVIHDGTKPRSFNLSFIMDRAIEYGDLKEIYAKMGMNPMAMLLSETQGDYEYCGYFHILDPPKAVHDYPVKSMVTLSLREAV